MSHGISSCVWNHCDIFADQARLIGMRIAVENLPARGKLRPGSDHA